MSEIANIIDELKNIHDGDAWHGLSLREALTDVTPQQAAARPVDDAHSIWELVHHITAWENVWRIRLEGQQATEPEEGDFPPVKEVSEQAWAQSLAELDATHKRLLGVISELSESVLEDTGCRHRVFGSLYAARRHSPSRLSRGTSCAAQKSILLNAGLSRGLEFR